MGTRRRSRPRTSSAVRIELLGAALPRAGLGAERPALLLEGEPGRRTAGLRVARPAAVLGAAGLHARRLVLHLREVRRPRRVPEPALLVAAREVEQPVERAGLEVDVRRRVADRAQAIRHG